MATSFLSCSELADSSLSLDLSLGGIFSQPNISCDIKFNSASFSSENLAVTSNKQAPPLPSKHSINNDNPMSDILSLGSAAPSSSTLIENPHHFVHSMDGMHSQSHHGSVKRRKGLESEEKRQQKRARKEEPSIKGHGSNSLCNSYVSNSGILHKAHNLPTGDHDHSSLPLDKNMRGFDVDLMPLNGSHHRISDMKKAVITEAPVGLQICWESALHQPNQETPVSLVACNHSPAVSCTSCVHAQATPSCTPSSYSPTQKASCPSTSSLTLITPCFPSSSGCTPTLETGSNGIINYMLSTKWKSCIGGDDDGKGCHSSSSELENENNQDEQSTTQTKVTELEAPRSRCGSNSDIIGSVDPSAAIPSTSSMMYTQPFAMLPVQSPFSMPIQWGYALPYAMHYFSHTMPPLASPLSSSFATNNLPENKSLSWIPFVPASPSCSRPGVLGASCNEGKLQDKQETSCEENALTCGLALNTPASTAKYAKVQPLSQIKDLSPAMVHETIPRSISDVCTSAAPSSPLFSTSPQANYSSDVRTSSTHPLMSSTSPTANYLSDSHVQVDPRKPGPVKEVCRSSLLKACSNFSTTGDGVISCQLFSQNQVDRSKARNSCPLKSDDAAFLGGQSQDSISPGRKPTKTVRFSSDERELVKSLINGKPTKTVRFSSDEREHEKSISNEDQRHASSSLLSKSCKSVEMGKSCKSQLVEKTWGGEAVCSRIQHNSGLTKRSTQERQQDDGSANTQITSESSDQAESEPLKVEGKNAANNLPHVSTTCAANGKTIYGVMYITKSKQTCLICKCHGTHMSPSEFVQHSGSTDLSNPERSIVMVTGFSCVKQL